MGRKTGSLNHTHKYYRLNDIWFCGSPGCTHYMPKNMPPPVYKLSICWTCRLPMELNPDNMMSTHPVHDHCEAYIYTPPPMSPTEMESDEEKLEREIARRKIKNLTPESTDDDWEKRKLDMIRAGSLIPPALPPLPPLPVTEPIVHTDGCASRTGSACDCGAE